jgi:hypothetical protein
MAHSHRPKVADPETARALCRDGSGLAQRLRLMKSQLDKQNIYSGPAEDSIQVRPMSAERAVGVRK